MLELLRRPNTEENREALRQGQLDHLTVKMPPREPRPGGSGGPSSLRGRPPTHPHPEERASARLLLLVSLVRVEPFSRSPDCSSWCVGVSDLLDLGDMDSLAQGWGGAGGPVGVATITLGPGGARRGTRGGGNDKQARTESERMNERHRRL